MTTTAVADSKKAQLHAACALCGSNIRKIQDVPVKEGLAKLLSRGRNLSHRTIRHPADPHLVEFRDALNAVRDMALDSISYRGKRLVATALTKANALDNHFPH